jgi:TnpA family transposase
MDFSSEKERWAVWSVQARRFAKRENYTDAVARMSLVKRSMEDALTRVTDAADRKELEALLSRATEQFEDLRASYDEWRTAIATRRQATIDNAAEEMARPIPASSE